METDDELIERAKLGDPDAWGDLYRAHAGRLMAWLGTRPSGDSAVSCEDLAAEAWLTAARKIPQFVGDSSDFAGWLFGIARNLALNTQRRSRRRTTDPASEPPDRTSATTPEATTLERDWVGRVLDRLPPRERDVIACLEVVGLDIDSTSRALGISAVAVRVARHRGLRRLRGLPTFDLTDGPTPLVGQGAQVSSRSRSR